MNQRTIQAVLGQLSDVQVALRVERIHHLPGVLDAQIRVARGVLNRLGLRHSTSPTSPKSVGVVAVFWFAPRSAKVHLLLATAGGGRLVTRSVATAGEEGRYEALAIVVRTALRAHLSGTTVGVALPPPRARPTREGPKPIPSSATAPTRAPTAAIPRLTLATSYMLGGYASEAYLVHGLQLTILGNLHPHWSVFVSYRFEAPIAVEGERANLWMWRHPVSLGARFRWLFGPVELGADLALGLTALTRRTTLLEEDTQLRVTGPGVLFSVTPALYAGYRPLRRLMIFLSVGVTFYPVQRRYEVLHEGDLERLLSPWVVQPSVHLGLAVDLI